MLSTALYGTDSRVSDLPGHCKPGGGSDRAVHWALPGRRGAVAPEFR
jgi:hypothetical protein